MRHSIWAGRPWNACTWFATTVALFWLGAGCHNAGPAEAPDPTARVGSDTRLRVGTSGDYAPFSQWPEKAGAPTGFSIDVARAYAADRDIELEWVRFEWPGLAKDLASGRFDVALSGVTVRPDRSIQARFSTPLTRSGAVVLVPTRAGIASAAELDAAGRRLAVNAGGHLERVARRLFPRARIEAVPDNARVIGALEAGRADAVLTDTLEAPHWMAATPGLRAIGPLTRDRKAAWFRRAARSRLQDFDRWLLEAEATGKLAELRLRHGLPDARTATPGAALLARLDERLSLMRDVADVKLVMGRPIEDRPREERVLDAAQAAVERIARKAGHTTPPPSAVRDVFRAQIEAAKWIQHARLENRSASLLESKGESRDSARERLERSIRPALIDLGDEIASLLVALMASGDPAPTDQEVADALSRHDLPETLLEALHASIAELLSSATASAPAPPPTLAARGTAPNA